MKSYDFPSDDVWDLPTSNLNVEVVSGPGDCEPVTKGYWVTDPVANTWHDCSDCRGIIGSGDPYHRQAILLKPDQSGDPRGTVMVIKSCKGCYTP